MIQHGPRVATTRELVILTVAAAYILLWIVCMVMAINNVIDRNPMPPRVTPATCPNCEAVPYQEEP